MGRTGTELAAAWRTLKPADRDAAILDAVRARELPAFVTDQPWPTVNRTIVVEGKTRSLFMYVLPFVAYGTDADPLWYPCREDTAQSIADSLGSIILTPTLVREVFHSPAVAKIALQIPPKLLTLTGAAHDAYMQSPDAFESHSALVNAEIANAIAAGSAKSAAFAAGHSKNLVLGPHLDGTHIAIYGGFNPAGGYKGLDGKWHPAADGWAWQPYPGPHVLEWIDDADLFGLLFSKGFLDGVQVDLAPIFEDPILCTLVADATPQTKAAGPFPARFPTSSPGKVTTMPKPTPLPASLPTPRKSAAPFAPATGVIWPVVTTDPMRLCVSYVGTDGSIVACSTPDATAGRWFEAVRDSSSRLHAGIDLIAHEGDPIVAAEDGRIIGSIPGYVGLDAIVVEHPNVVIVYGEIASGSLARASLHPGDIVKAGQVIGYGGRSSSGTMLHVETWQKGHAPAAFTPWVVSTPPPAGLLDPTLYFLSLAKRTGSGSSTPPPARPVPTRSIGAGLGLAAAFAATGIIFASRRG